MKSNLQMRKTILLFIFATLCLPFFSNAKNEIMVVAEISKICNPGGDPGVWVQSGGNAPLKAREYMGLRKGDRVRVDEKSRAVVLIHYGLPTESPVLVSRLCGKAMPACRVGSFHERKVAAECLTNQSPYYEIHEPAADTPFLEKIAQLFTDVFHHIGKSEYDLSVTPYSDHRPQDKRSLRFSPVAPSGCAILKNQPVFYWSGPANQTYTLEVFEKETGKKLWNSNEVKDLHLSYSGEPLSPGMYIWRLHSNKQSVDASFEILTEEKRLDYQELLKSFEAPLFKDYPEDQILLLKAAALVDRQLYADALPLLLTLRNQKSHHPAVPALLREVYGKQGRPDLSRDEQQKIVELGK